MVCLRILRPRHLYTLLDLQNPTLKPLATNDFLSLNYQRTSLFSSIFRRPFSLSPQSEHEIDTEQIVSDNVNEKSDKPRKPLDVFFKEAVGLSQKLESSDVDEEEETDNRTWELKKNLMKLEEQVRKFGDNGLKTTENSKVKPKIESNPKSLYGLFASKTRRDSEKIGPSRSKRVENPTVYKVLSPDMVVFVNHLYREGYFRHANFLPENRFDVTCFENSYGRDFVKFAAEKFGEDNQEIAKWLSGSDLKKVAVFGCPSLARKTVFSAKRLRNFFRIQEDTVCRKCVLRESCNFVNQNVWKTDQNNLNLGVVMRVIILYALDSVHPQLVVPDEIKNSVSRLLKEVLNLSQTVS